MSSCPSSEYPSSENSPLSRSITSCKAGWTLWEMDSEGNWFSTCVPGFFCPCRALVTLCSRGLPEMMELPLKYDGGSYSWGPELTGTLRQLTNGPSEFSGTVINPCKGCGTRVRFISNPRRDSGARTCTGTKERCPVVGS